MVMAKLAQGIMAVLALTTVHRSVAKILQGPILRYANRPMCAVMAPNMYIVAHLGNSVLQMVNVREIHLVKKK